MVVDTIHAVWHRPHIDRSMRRVRLGHRSMVIWFTGLPGSGKSTLAHAVEERLFQQHRVATYVLDGDNVRHGLSGDLGFDVASRAENIRRIGEVCRLFLDAGVVVLCAFISPDRRERERLRSMFEAGEFVEVYVQTPLEVCESRDPKGHYRRARAGEIQNYTGISAPYEEPVNPEMVVSTEQDSVERLVERLVGWLEREGLFGGGSEAGG